MGVSHVSKHLGESGKARVMGGDRSGEGVVQQQRSKLRWMERPDAWMHERGGKVEGRHQRRKMERGKGKGEKNKAKKNKEKEKQRSEIH